MICLEKIPIFSILVHDTGSKVRNSDPQWKVTFWFQNHLDSLKGRFWRFSLVRYLYTRIPIILIQIKHILIQKLSYVRNYDLQWKRPEGKDHEKFDYKNSYPKNKFSACYKLFRIRNLLINKHKNHCSVIKTYLYINLSASFLRKDVLECVS